MTRLSKANLRRAEYLAVISAVSFVVLIGASVGYVGLDAVAGHLAGLGGGLIAGLLGLSLINYGLRAVRWHVYGRHLGLRVGFGRMTLFYGAGFAMAATPGKIGEALRLWLIERTHGYRYQRTVPLLIGDRVSDFNAVLILMLASVPTVADDAWLAAGVAVAVLLVAVAVLRAAWLVRATRAIYCLVGRWPRLFAGASTSFRHAARLFDPKIYGLALALALMGWLAECVAFHWLLVHLGAGTGLLQAVFIFSFSVLVGAITMLPGGLGSAEATMFGLLAYSGVEADRALAATAIIRVATLWFAVFLGFLALPTALRQARTAAPGDPRRERSS